MGGMVGRGQSPWERGKIAVVAGFGDVGQPWRRPFRSAGCETNLLRRDPVDMSGT